MIFIDRCNSFLFVHSSVVGVWFWLLLFNLKFSELLKHIYIIPDFNFHFIFMYHFQETQDRMYACNNLFIRIKKATIDRLKKLNLLDRSIFGDGMYCTKLIDDIFGKETLIAAEIDQLLLNNDRMNFLRVT